MAYGYKSRFRKSAARARGGRSSRFGYVTKVGSRSKKTYTRKAVTRRLYRQEVKHDDDYFNLNQWQKYNQIGLELQSGFVNYVLGGIMSTDVVVGASGGIGQGAGGAFQIDVNRRRAQMVPNCLTNVPNGNTAISRIGNVIQPKFITLKCVMNAAMTTEVRDGETTAKAEGGTVDQIIARYMRTSIKVMIIRDKSMNEKGFVTFSDVFDVPTEAGGGQLAGQNPYLWNRKIDTLGRYEILKSSEFQLDQDDPQKSFTWNIPLKGIPIRFNGSSSSAIGIPTTMATTGTALDPSGGVPGTFYDNIAIQRSSESQSMTNGIYILAVSHSSTTVSGNNVSSPALVFSTRMSFVD